MKLLPCCMRDFFPPPVSQPHPMRASILSTVPTVVSVDRFHFTVMPSFIDFPHLQRLPRLVFPPANSKEWNTFDLDLKVELRYIISDYDLQNKLVAYLMEKLISFTYLFFENRLPLHVFVRASHAPQTGVPPNLLSIQIHADTLKAKMRELRKNIRKNPTSQDKSEYHLTRKHYLRQRNLEELRLSHESEFANTVNRRFRKKPDRNLLNPPKAGDPKFVEEEANA